MEDCIKDRCKKTCDEHSECVSEVAVLKNQRRDSWKWTSLLVLIAVGVIGYTHVKGSEFESRMADKTASIEANVARIEERIAGVKVTMAHNHAELIQRLRTIDRATAAIATNDQRGGSTSLMARDF